MGDVGCTGYRHCQSSALIYVSKRETEQAMVEVLSAIHFVFEGSTVVYVNYACNLNGRQPSSSFSFLFATSNVVGGWVLCGAAVE